MWKLTSDHESKRLIIDQFAQFLEDFHLKSSLHHMFE